MKEKNLCNNHSRILLWISAMCILLTSCRTDMDVEEVRHNYTAIQKEIRSKFTEKYGLVSYNHSWMNILEGETSVSFDTSIPTGNFTLRVYTTDPRQERTDCYILAETRLSGRGSSTLQYDYPVGLKYVYVAVVNENASYIKRINTGTGISAVINETDIYEKPISNTAMEYLLCFETILTQDSTHTDFDYNDAIIGLEYVRGRETAKINLKALGANEAVRVLFNQKNKLEIDKLGVIVFEDGHTEFGLPPFYSYIEKRDIYYELNTGKYSMTIKPSYEVELESLFGSSAKSLIQRVFVSFGKDDDKKTANKYFIEDNYGCDMPTGICVPQPTWKWPEEGVEIEKTCGLFKDWVNDCWANPFWYDATWLIANNREHDNPADNSPYGQELALSDSLITSEQLLPYLNYTCSLVIKVSEVKENVRLRLCKFCNTPILYVKDVDVTTDGIYEVVLTPSDIYKITETQTTGQAGLQFIYDGFEIDGVYIR